MLMIVYQSWRLRKKKNEQDREEIVDSIQIIR